MGQQDKQQTEINQGSSSPEVQLSATEAKGESSYDEAVERFMASDNVSMMGGWT